MHQRSTIDGSPLGFIHDQTIDAGRYVIRNTVAITGDADFGATVLADGDSVDVTASGEYSFDTMGGTFSFVARHNTGTIHGDIFIKKVA